MIYEIRIVVITSESKIQRILDYIVDLIEWFFALGAGKLLVAEYEKIDEINEE